MSWLHEIKNLLLQNLKVAKKSEDLGPIYSKKAWQVITQQVITQQHEVTKKNERSYKQ